MYRKREYAPDSIDRAGRGMIRCGKPLRPRGFGGAVHGVFGEIDAENTKAARGKPIGVIPFPASGIKEITARWAERLRRAAKRFCGGLIVTAIQKTAPGTDGFLGIAPAGMPGRQGKIPACAAVKAMCLVRTRTYDRTSVVRYA